MFSKSRINETATKPSNEGAAQSHPAETPSFLRQSSVDTAPSQVTKSKPAASVLASDLTITGNLRTTGDIVIEGNVDGDIRAHLLTVGETATIRGEIVADDIVINGRVIGRVRGLKVRLTSAAQVEGDIIHKTIAIESGAHFEGSVQRQDDPLQTNRGAVQQPQPAQNVAPQPAPAAMSEAVKKATEQKKNASNS
ncbi:bactofilin family protein [Roseinatronobacter sp. NSM]|uniref:bactofilin family protein n=1 Tax=Roseinatronobacter sp. NSM TaxID=3457785 RepID=UPI004037256C